MPLFPTDALRSARRAFSWSPAGEDFFANHFTIRWGNYVCAQWPHTHPITLVLTESLTHPMLPYPSLTHWAALRRCDRSLVAKIFVILAPAGNAERIRHMVMETKLFVSQAPAGNRHTGSTALSVRT